MSELAQLITQVAAKQTGKDLLMTQNSMAIEKMAARWIEEGRGHLAVHVEYLDEATQFERILVRVVLMTRTLPVIFEVNYFLTTNIDIEKIEEKFKDKLQEILDQN